MMQSVSSARVIIVAVCAIGILAGCSSTPKLVETWRPWTASFGDADALVPGSTVHVTVDTDKGPFTGSQLKRNDYLKGEAEDVLKRKGFQPTDGAADYEVTLHYKTETVQKMISSTHVRNVNVASSVASVNTGDAKTDAYAALGAAVISLFASSLASSDVEQPIGPTTAYIHTVNIAVKDKAGSVAWQSDAYWESPVAAIEEDWRLAIQTQMFTVPGKPGERVWVPRLKTSAVQQYYDTYCKNQRFSAPGLPYSLRFSARGSIVNNQEAYPAYVDLLRNAEIALPIGDDDYADPTHRRLWSNVMLGGEYVLGPLKEPANILVTLYYDKHGGFIVDRARIATDTEYAQFQARLEHWHSALSRYYDMYE